MVPSWLPAITNIRTSSWLKMRGSTVCTTSTPCSKPRSVNGTPFGQDGAGFSDMSITAKTMLLDSELFLFGFQMRTYIPIGQTGKGLGTGHVSLEPGE